MKPEIEPTTSCSLVGFVSAVPQWELYRRYLNLGELLGGRKKGPQGTLEAKLSRSTADGSKERHIDIDIGCWVYSDAEVI